MKNKKLAYTLTRETTRHQTGFFVVTPDEALSTEDALPLLKSRPMDDFLHQYVLTRITSLSTDALQQLLNQSSEAENPVYRALVAEHLLLTKGRDALAGQFSPETIDEISRHTPLIYLRSFLEPDQSLHRQWTTFFRTNLQEHKPLIPPEETGLPPLTIENQPTRQTATLSELAVSTRQNSTSPPRTPSPDQTAATAAQRLEKAGVELGQLMRHEASLSPIGLLRSWQFARRVDHRRNRFSLSGEQTSYGRGLSLDAARASLMMEIVERCSAFAAVSDDGLADYQNDYPLRRATFNEIRVGNAIDPSSLSLEVAYRDQTLHWVEGVTPDPHDRNENTRPIWVPAQCLFLFCNLDEPSLFSGLGSTGLASGNTPAQARVAALLEVIERHQAATVPYDLSTCFRLVAHDARIEALLEAYGRAGIDLWFQDITPAMGVPCCRCFVVEQSGIIHTGTAAHLDARRAIISAITETTCPFPNPPPTRPASTELVMVGYENLPDYSTNDHASDLVLLETLLIKNHYQPCYVDLTRKDIGLPVVRAIIPGMELLGDFDAYSRVHPALYNNYLSLFEK